MKNISNKYSRIHGGVTLLSYLLVFILHIIHFHNFELNSLIAVDSGDISKKHSNNSVSEYSCIVHQNFCSLNTTVLPCSISFPSFDNCGQSLPVGSKINSINNFQLITNHLRAPPLST